MLNILKNTDRHNLRQWFEANSESETECWVYLRRGKCADSEILTYLDAVEEAICFGWIDSTCRKAENGLCCQRFSKRKSDIWTELNKARAERLIKLGMMNGNGMEAFRKAQPFHIDEEISAAFARNEKARINFMNFPELYRRIRIDNIQRYKSDRKLFQSRLDRLIENCEQNRMYGEWNDNGRLE